MQPIALEGNLDGNGNGLGKAAALKTCSLDGPQIELKIREFVARNLLFSENGFPYPNEASFLGHSVIDSLGVLELVTFTGREFGLQIDASEVTPENFDSVSRLAAYIRRKQPHPEATRAGT